MTAEASATPKRSPTCIFQGVPPRMCPTFRSCSISPATAAATQMTAATPRTAATPGIPETPRITMSSAAMISVEIVSPLIGLLLEPMSPTRLPETAEKKNPATTITSVAITAASTSPAK